MRSPLSRCISAMASLKIWTQASRWTTDELSIRASGETLNPAHFKAHLEKRYLG